MFRQRQTPAWILPAALIIYLSLPALMSAGAANRTETGKAQQVHSVQLEASELPRRFELEQNSPNPFKLSTAIAYIVRIGEDPVKVTIEILDDRGNCVRTLVDDLHNPGQYSFWWRGTDDQGRALESGTYFCRLRADENEATRQVVISE
jgi:flagellar hook assembly protein FlgD